MFQLDSERTMTSARKSSGGFQGSRAVDAVADRASDPMRRFVLITSTFLLGIAVWGLTAVEPHGRGSAQCRTLPHRLGFGPAIEASMLVRSDMACPILARMPSLSIDALDIRTPPQNGTVSPRGRTGVIYRPHRGFKGEDSFVFTMRGKSDAYQGTSVVRVRATVK